MLGLFLWTLVTLFSGIAYKQHSITAQTATPPPKPTWPVNEVPTVVLNAVPQLPWTLLRTGNHDRTCFTQGLTLLTPTKLLESCGLYDHSRVMLMDLTPVYKNRSSDPVVQLSRIADRNVFFEGVTIANNKLYILTWRENQLIEMSLPDLTLQNRIHYPYHGWGLAYDDANKTFLATNGTEYILHFDLVQSHTPTHRNPSVVVKRQVPVQCYGYPVNNLNALEYDGKYLYANVWYSPLIFKVDPYTGTCVGYLDLTSLLEPQDVLNGIALVKDYSLSGESPKRGTQLWITGKLWNYMHLIEVEETPKLPS